ncbi:MAG: hypothetical protein CL484_07440 [Acidobacteria bacterium]|nr:hypothetical protein [Acidobacteriota bacterium]
MSMLKQKSTATAEVAAVPTDTAVAATTDPTAAALTDDADNVVKMRTARVLVTANATGADLKAGGVVAVQPVANSDDDRRLLQNAIIKRVRTTAWNNPIGGSIMVSAQLASNNQQPIHHGSRNKAGWLAHDVDAFGALPPAGNFTPLMAMMPWETSRNEQTLYEPSYIENEALVERYSSVSPQNLTDGIIPFPGQDYYYLDKDHVVADVMSRNWDKLGIDPASERTREGKWLKVQRSIVDHCLQQLKDNVLSKLPSTDLQDGLAVHFAADRNTEDINEHSIYPITLELSVDYTLPNERHTDT